MSKENAESVEPEFTAAESGQVDLTPEIDELEELGEVLGNEAPGTNLDHRAWRQGYPYKSKMTRRDYENQKRHLQIELLKLQAWTKESSQKIVLLFEGRDAAGKGRRDQTFYGASQSPWRASCGARNPD